MVSSCRKEHVDIRFLFLLPYVVFILSSEFISDLTSHELHVLEDHLKRIGGFRHNVKLAK